MAGAVTAIASVISAAVGGVSAVVGAIAGTISSAIGPVVSFIGSSVGKIASVIGTAVSAVGQTIGNIGGAVFNAIGTAAGGVIKTIGSAAKKLSSGLVKVIKDITKAMGDGISGLLRPIRDGLKVVNNTVNKIASWVNSAFHPTAELQNLKTAHPDIWAAAGGNDKLFIQDLVTSGTISPTQASLLGMPDVINIINEASSLKILSDLVKGNAGIWGLLDTIAGGNSYDTAKAIAKLSQQILQTSTGIIDQVSTDVELLQASIMGFDENVRRSMQMLIDETKAEVIARFTPKIDILGKYGLELNRKIAAIFRHVEDEDWFLIMLLRILPT